MKGIYLNENNNIIEENTMNSLENNGIYLEKTKDINIIGCRTICDICGERMAEKYFVQGQDSEFEKYKARSKLQNKISINKDYPLIVGVCSKCL